MERLLGLVVLNGILLFSIIFIEAHAGPRPLTISLLVCLNPLLGLTWLPHRSELGIPVAVAVLIAGPFVWAGFVETILRRFVDGRAEE